jgi:hypothetical protein
MPPRSRGTVRPGALSLGRTPRAAVSCAAALAVVAVGMAVLLRFRDHEQPLRHGHPLAFPGFRQDRSLGSTRACSGLSSRSVTIPPRVLPVLTKKLPRLQTLVSPKRRHPVMPRPLATVRTGSVAALM